MNADERSRRDKSDIISAILKLAKNGEKKTRIMYQANLSFEQTNRYLKELEKGGFLRIEEGKHLWFTTADGLKVLEACGICKRLLDSFSTKELTKKDKVMG